MMLIMEEARHVYGQGMHGKSMYLPSNFIVYLKLPFFKSVSIFKRHWVGGEVNITSTLGFEL